MSGVKLLVYVEITNEDICRLHLTLCTFSLSNYWFLILVLNIEVEVFNLNNLWGFQFEQFVNFTSTQKILDLHTKMGYPE